MTASFSLFWVGAVSAIAFVCASALLRTQYKELSSAEKADVLWHHILANETSGSFMSALKTLKILGDLGYLRNMQDDHDSGDWRDPDHRKISHGIGMHARAHFNWYHNNYTGLFQQADNCIVRLANAAEPGGSTTYGPNMGIKCTRDGEAESANLQLIYEIDGYDVYPVGKQGSCSYFEGPLVNMCARRDDIALPLKLFVRQFAKMDARPFMLGVSQMATADQEGRPVERNVNFPYALIFQPNPVVAQLHCHVDDVTSQLRHINPATTLFKVYAEEDPGTGAVPIGELVLDTGFVTSLFGDRQLFFRHTFFSSQFSLLSDDRREAWQDFTSMYTDFGMGNQKKAGHAVYEPLPPF